jgi:hypothetical protein
LHHTLRDSSDDIVVERHNLRQCENELATTTLLRLNTQTRVTKELVEDLTSRCQGLRSSFLTCGARSRGSDGPGPTRAGALDVQCRTGPDPARLADTPRGRAQRGATHPEYGHDLGLRYAAAQAPQNMRSVDFPSAMNPPTANLFDDRAIARAELEFCLAHDYTFVHLVAMSKVYSCFVIYVSEC